MGSSENTEARVYDGQKVVRTYTKKEHGKDFAKLAKQFAEKNNYKLDK